MIQSRGVKCLRLMTLALAALTLSHCAHQKAPLERSPDALLREVCQVGTDVRAARGFVTVSAKSKDASGRFPATVEATADPKHLKIEVTNLTGGTEAKISVEGEKYEIEIPGKKKLIDKGYGQWSGLPLRWASDLFLGRIPCPAVVRSSENPAPFAVSIEADGRLRVVVKGGMGRDEEVFVYTVSQHQGHAWPDTLRWERHGTFTRNVEFKFFDAEPETLSPRHWEAKGLEGVVKMRWNDRKTDRSAGQASKS